MSASVSRSMVTASRPRERPIMNSCFSSSSLWSLKTDINPFHHGDTEARRKAIRIEMQSDVEKLAACLCRKLKSTAVDGLAGHEEILFSAVLRASVVSRLSCFHQFRVGNGCRLGFLFRLPAQDRFAGGRGFVHSGDARVVWSADHELRIVLHLAG